MTDFRYALRQLFAAPGFTLAAVLSLALGVGANTAVFSMANALLLRPVTSVRPDDVVRIYVGRHSPLGYEELSRVRRSGAGFSHVAGERTVRVGRTDTPVPQALTGAVVAGDYFALLGVRPEHGRLFTAADTTPEAAGIVVLSHAYWREAFGADPGAVGRVLRINGQGFTVTGVLPEGFRGSMPVWRPALYFPVPAVTPLMGIRPVELGGSLYALGRIAPGGSPRQVEAALRTLGRRLVAEDSGRYARDLRDAGAVFRIGVARGLPAETRGPTMMGASFMLVLVALVLLIACANVANLLLARATTRARELGVRAALGARRLRLVRQLLVESTLLAAMGGVLAIGVSILVAGRVSAWIVSKAPEPVGFDVGVDGRVLAYTALLCGVAVLAFGLVPALRASRPDLAGVLREGSRGTDGRGGRLRALLVGGQVALCTIVLATAALFGRSLAASQGADPGFPAAGVVDLRVEVEPRRLAPAVERAFFGRLLEQARALPGVEHAALAATVPLGGQRRERGLWVDGGGEEPPMRMTDFNVVGEGYFATLGIPIVRGREFGREERAGEPGAVVVNEAFARRMWPGAEALGGRVSLRGPQGPWLVVIGVARDIRYNALGEEPTPMLYQPWGQFAGGDMVLHARTAPERVAAVGSALERLLRGLDPLLPPVAAAPIARDMGTALLMAQMSAALLGGFGVLAMVLASIGIYGITTYAVAQRTREIGIRVALGAERDDVVRLVASRTARPVMAGLAVGLTVATGVSFLLRAQLYGVSAGDPLALVGTALAIAAVAALAAWAPVRRATRLDPSRALAAE